MSRSFSTNGRKCYSCRPGCRCSWCESADNRADMRQGKVTKKSLKELVEEAESGDEIALQKS